MKSMTKPCEPIICSGEIYDKNMSFRQKKVYAQLSSLEDWSSLPEATQRSLFLQHMLSQPQLQEPAPPVRPLHYPTPVHIAPPPLNDALSQITVSEPQPRQQLSSNTTPDPHLMMQSANQSNQQNQSLVDPEATNALMMAINSNKKLDVEPTNNSLSSGVIATNVLHHMGDELVKSEPPQQQQQHQMLKTEQPPQQHQLDHAGIQRHLNMNDEQYHQLLQLQQLSQGNVMHQQQMMHQHQHDPIKELVHQMNHSQRLSVSCNGGPSHPSTDGSQPPKQDAAKQLSHSQSSSALPPNRSNSYQEALVQEGAKTANEMTSLTQLLMQLQPGTKPNDCTTEAPPQEAVTTGSSPQLEESDHSGKDTGNTPVPEVEVKKESNIINSLMEQLTQMKKKNDALSQAVIEEENRRTERERIEREQQEREEKKKAEEIRIKKERELAAIKKKQEEEQQSKLRAEQKKKQQEDEKKKLAAMEAKRKEEEKKAQNKPKAMDEANKRQEEKRKQKEAEQRKKDKEEKKKQQDAAKALAKQQKAVEKQQQLDAAAAEAESVWGAVPLAPSVSHHREPSLLDIQRKQQEKDKMDRDRDARELEAARVEAALRKTPSAITLKWAEKGQGVGQGKSILQIQQEEERQAKLAMLREASQTESTVKAAPAPAPSQPDSWASRAGSQTKPVAWASEQIQNASSGVGFWDLGTNKPAQAVKKQSLSSAVSSAKLPQVANNNNNKKMKQNMSTPALHSVTKQTKSKDVALDAFNGWTRNCLMTMKIEKTVDRVEFVEFIRNIDSPYEVHDYIRQYLGDTSELKKFAKDYLDRRSECMAQQRQQKKTGDDITQPAKAVTPGMEFQEANKKNKSKNKKKMQKADSSILGFQSAYTDA